MGGPEGIVESIQIMKEGKASASEAVDCKWYIRAPPRSKVSLKVKTDLTVSLGTVWSMHCFEQTEHAQWVSECNQKLLLYLGLKCNLSCLIKGSFDVINNMEKVFGRYHLITWTRDPTVTPSFWKMDQSAMCKPWV